MANFTDFGQLVGKHSTSFPTLSDGDLNELQLDSSGRLILSGRYLEDTTHTTGDAGLNILAVRNDSESSLVDTDGDYAPLQVDSNGRLKVATVVSVEPSDAEFNEDTAHTSGDTGLHMLAVRQDTLGASTDADGDYSSLKVDSDGELYVTDVEVRTTLSSIDSTLSGLSQDEDSTHSSGDAGIMSLAVRADSEGSLVDTDGDYAPLQLNDQGRLRTTSHLDSAGAEEYGVSDDLAASGDGLIAMDDTFTDVASISVAAGETARIYGWNFGADETAVGRMIVDDGTDTFVYKISLNSSANPSVSEHWGESGRIEIAGSATTSVKIQVRLRQSGNTGQGTGSIHARIV